MPLVIVGLGIVALLILILLKVKPLYAILIVALGVGLGEGLSFDESIFSIGKGVLTTLQSMLVVLALGAMFGKVIEVSGAARQITNTLIRRFGKANISWAISLTGLLVGIPLFYNAGFVILIPLVFAVSRSAHVPILLVGIPMAASLSVTHGFLPPHPGPTAIAAIFHADVGKTMLYGLVLAVPTVILAGPIFSRTLTEIVVQPKSGAEEVSPEPVTLPSASRSMLLALMPVLLIASATLLTTFFSETKFSRAMAFLGDPAIALLLSLVLSLLLFRIFKKQSTAAVIKMLFFSVRDIGVIILIIAAGGGFKQVLVDSGIGTYIQNFSSSLDYSPLLLGWLVAAIIRVSVGSATVAALTAAGVVAPLITAGVSPELMVLAVGSGSLMFSHVNDTGFWMFKEYFNLSLQQTFRSWTLMETIVSICGLLGVLVLDQVV